MKTIEELKNELNELNELKREIIDLNNECESLKNYMYECWKTSYINIIIFRRNEFTKIKKIFTYSDTFAQVSEIKKEDIEKVSTIKHDNTYLTNDEKDRVLNNFIYFNNEKLKNIEKTINELIEKILNYEKYINIELLKQDYGKQHKYFESLVGQGIYTFNDGEFIRNTYKANPTITSDSKTKTLYVYGQRACALDYITNTLIFYDINHSTTVVKYINKFLEDSGIYTKYAKINDGDTIKTTYKNWKVYFHKNYYNENNLTQEDIIPQVLEYLNNKK